MSLQHRIKTGAMEMLIKHTFLMSDRRYSVQKHGSHKEKKQQKDMGKGGRALRFLFGVAVLVAVVWLLFVGMTIANHATVVTKSRMVPSTRDFKHWEFFEQERRNSHQDFHLSYVSKRRVPNGPDPIHNRKAATSRQPPGRA